MSRSRFLIIENNHALRLMVEQHLRDIDRFDVSSAEDADVGIERANVGQFDVVIASLHLPDMTPARLLDALASVLPRPDIVTIATPERARTLDKRRAELVSAMLELPFSRSDLHSAALGAYHRFQERICCSVIPKESRLRSKPAKREKKRRKGTGRPVMLDRFEVLEQLAVGAKGAVYRGRDTKRGDTVAIRAIPTGLVERLVSGDRWLERFLREASTAASINHPNLTAILEHGFDEERRCLYLVTEFVEGTTVERLLEREETLQTSEALTMACRVAEALTAVHGGGCIHGLVGPSNVVAEKGGDFKLTDFGLNSMLGWDLMPLKDRLRKPPYLSPEQLRFGRIDDRSDQFSLGLVLYEALTGSYPFAGQSTAKKVQNILTTKARIELKDSGELEEVLERMLSTAPEDRFQGDTELSAALARCAEEFT